MNAPLTPPRLTWPTDRTRQRRGGFTLVELVVVILVMALLAAVGIVAFNQVTGNARVAAAKAELTTVAKAAVAELTMREASAFDAVWVTPLYGEVIAEVDAGETAAGVFTPLGPDTPLTQDGQYGLAFKDMAGQVNATQGVGVTFATWVDGAVVSVSASVAGTIADHEGEDTAAWAGAALNTAVQQRANLATNPSFEAANGQVAVAENLYLNAAMRTGGSYGQIWAGATGNVAAGRLVDCSYASSGRAWRATWTTVGGYLGDFGVNIDDFSGLLGKKITVVFKARASRDVVRGPAIGGNSGTYTPHAQSPAQQIGPETIGEFWFTGTFREAGRRVGLSLNGALAPEVDTWVEMFDVDIYEGDYDPSRKFFCAGCSYPDPDLVPAWSGAANSSTTVMYGSAPRSLKYNDNQTSVQSKQWAASGENSLRIIPKNVDSYSDWVVLAPGRTYRISATVHLEKKLTGTLHQRRLGIQVYGYQGSTLFTNPVAGSIAPNEAGDHRVSVTWTAEPGLKRGIDRDGITYEIGVNVRLYNGASAGHGDVWWDDLLVEDITDHVPADDSYFDGDTPSTTRAQYRWTGARHGSTSTVLAW